MPRRLALAERQPGRLRRRSLNPGGGGSQSGSFAYDPPSIVPETRAVTPAEQAVSDGHPATGMEEMLRREIAGLREERERLVHRLSQSAGEARRLQQQLAEAERVKNDFVSVCAHDLRSPTNSMLSFLEILAAEGDHMPRQEREEVMRRMQRSGKHMLALIADLLEMVQIESGRAGLAPRPVLVSQVCREALAQLAGSFESKEIACGLDVRRGELKVSLDEKKGLQVAHNLLSNALKFTPRGGRVDVVVETRGKTVAVDVADTGPGIPEEELGRLFQKFARLSTRATDGEKGSGLGLTIVKQIVDLHGGNISVRSSVGKGTTFTVVLPVVESAALLKLFGGKAG